MRCGSSAGKLFRPEFYFLFFFYTLKTPFFRNTSERVLFIFSLETRIYIFVSLFLQKGRRRVPVFYKTELEICLIIPEVSLIFSAAFQNTEAAFERCSIKIVVQQNDMMKHSSSALVIKSRKAFHTNLLKTELYHRHFSKNLTTSSEQHNT